MTGIAYRRIQFQMSRDDKIIGDFTSNTEIVMSMFKRENDLRFSNEAQNLYDCNDLKAVFIPTMSIDDDMQ